MHLKAFFGAIGCLFINLFNNLKSLSKRFQLDDCIFAQDQSLRMIIRPDKKNKITQ
jgi:hypothetical protein